MSHAQDFEAFRYDLISHLSHKLGLPAELVTSKLGEWLLDRSHDDGPWLAELALANADAPLSRPS